MRTGALVRHPVVVLAELSRNLQRTERRLLHQAAPGRNPLPLTRQRVRNRIPNVGQVPEDCLVIPVNLRQMLHREGD